MALYRRDLVVCPSRPCLSGPSPGGVEGALTGDGAPGRHPL